MVRDPGPLIEVFPGSVGVAGDERRGHEDSIKPLGWRPPSTQSRGPARRRATRRGVDQGMKGLADRIELGVEVAGHNIDAE